MNTNPATTSCNEYVVYLKLHYFKILADSTNRKTAEIMAS